MGYFYLVPFHKPISAHAISYHNCHWNVSLPSGASPGMAFLAGSKGQNITHTSGGISSSPAAFLFLIFLRNESSSSLVNGPSLMSNCLLIILVIGSCVTFGGLSSRFSKCCFHRFIFSCCFSRFQFCFGYAFPSTHFVYCLPGYPRFIYLLDSICILNTNNFGKVIFNHYWSPNS